MLMKSKIYSDKCVLKVIIYRVTSSVTSLLPSFPAPIIVISYSYTTGVCDYKILEA